MADGHQDLEEPRVTVRAVAVSIVGFWGFYLLVLTIRSQINGLNHWFYLPPRIAVVLFNMGLSWLLYLALRTFARRSQPVRLAAAALLTVPAAIAYAAFDHYAFKGWQDHLALGGGLWGGSMGPSVGTAVIPDKMTLAGDLLDMGVNGWFFFVAWAALYLQLEAAGQVALLERHAAALRTSAQTAELRALRYQVNPHFLFNTLNALAALVLRGRSEEAGHMIARLGKFFRASLTANPTTDVSLADEFELQRLYLEIETVRFSDRLAVAIDLPEALAAAPVPALITQPLVENAIRHGVARTGARSLIKITAEADGNDRMRIAITNDIASGEAHEAPGFGIGLRNVIERLAARYGDEARLTTRIREERFAVTLHMPRSAGPRREYDAA